MLNKKFIGVAVLAVTIAYGCQPSVPPIETDMDRVSYAIGYDIGRSIQGEQIEGLDLDVLFRGMKDAATGEGVLTDDEMMDALMKFQQDMMERQQSQASELGANNLAEGQIFLDMNAQRDEVSVTPSGLQYRVIEEGSGPRPGPESEVTVHYRGTLIDGTEFDSSFSRGEPASFPLNRVIPGWTEGLQLMREGSTFEFFIPSELGYGERGTQGIIGPNAVLIFEVELISIDS
ncbi:MAG: FKBP-type peptidyl-prolyl cis-trans isomerase [Bacteroidetes bacterium]|nr:FKBP-type peptidyl-prolyl cis-trans isomerase [Bacteroidota bacterium]MCH8524023.1 FKBP-type peptidyl-prolyl cis-trans isomerase [Balneolales bacterium]